MEKYFISVVISSFFVETVICQCTSLNCINGYTSDVHQQINKKYIGILENIITQQANIIQQQKEIQASLERIGNDQTKMQSSIQMIISDQKLIKSNMVDVGSKLSQLKNEQQHIKSSLTGIKEDQQQMKLNMENISHKQQELNETISNSEERIKATTERQINASVMILSQKYQIMQSSIVWIFNQTQHELMSEFTYHGNLLIEELRSYKKEQETRPIRITDTRDCSEVYSKENGLYVIQPNNSLPVVVFCNQSHDSGGWTVLQRRQNGTTSFFRHWEDYTRGFGNITGEFWLGNADLHSITKQKQYTLRIDLQDFDGRWGYAEYSMFKVLGEEDSYQLILDGYRGTIGDSMKTHNGTYFSTTDMDNDEATFNCATEWKSGWWFKGCHDSNLNGPYLQGRHNERGRGIIWSSWTGSFHSLKYSQMMIRPTDTEELHG